MSRTEHDEPPVNDWPVAFELIAELRAVAAELGASPAQVSLAYLLGRPGVTSVILGARNVEQLQQNLAAVDVELSEQASACLERAAPQPTVYPAWHKERYDMGDRLPG